MPNRGREQVGVRGAEQRAVGLAVVVQYRVADGLAQQVHVAGHVRRGVVVDQRAAMSGTARVEPGPGPLPGSVLAGADGERGQSGQQLVLCRHGRKAADLRAVAEAARVKRDDVVPFPQHGRKLTEACREPLDLLVGAAAVEEQRAKPPTRAGGPVPDHGDADRRAAGLGVAQRHPGGGALKPAVAGTPGQDRNPRCGRPVRRGDHGRWHRCGQHGDGASQGGDARRPPRPGTRGADRAACSAFRALLIHQIPSILVRHPDPGCRIPATGRR